MTRGVWMETLTWPEAAAWIDSGAVVVVPIGAIAKEHGPHLPLNTDFTVARALADGVAAALPVLVAPVVGFGFYPAFTAYKGSQHLKAETFIALLGDLLEKLVADGARRIVLINTGVSTEAPVELAARGILDRTGVRLYTAHIRQLGRAVAAQARQALGGHADEMETSTMLAVAPDLVRLDRAVPDYGHLRAEPRTVFVRPVRFSPDPAAGIDYSATGARGDPTLASAELGRAYLDAMVRELVDGIRALFPGADAAAPAPF